MTKPKTVDVVLDPNSSKGDFKLLGGGEADEWNRRINDFTINALPIAPSNNRKRATEVALAVSYGAMEIAPADPIEGILIAQLMAANEAALAMYRKGWAQPPDFTRHPWRTSPPLRPSLSFRYTHGAFPCDRAEPFRRSPVAMVAAELGNRQSRMRPHGVMPGRLFY